jgi:hypothetical protein
MIIFLFTGDVGGASGHRVEINSIEFSGEQSCKIAKSNVELELMLTEVSSLKVICVQKDWG